MNGTSWVKLASGWVPTLGIVAALVGTALSALETSATPADQPTGFDVTNLTAFGLLAFSFVAVLGWVLKQLPKEIDRVEGELRDLRRVVLHNQISVEHLALQLGIHDALARGIDTNAQLDEVGLDKAARSFSLWRTNQDRLLRELESIRDSVGKPRP